MTLRCDGLAWLRVAFPFELLLGMKQLGEIDRRIPVFKQLGGCYPERIDGGKCRRHAGCGVGADRPRKFINARAIDLEGDRRVGSLCH